MTSGLTKQQRHVDPCFHNIIRKRRQLVVCQVQDLQTTRAVKDLRRQVLQLVLRHVQDASPTKSEILKGACMQLLQLVLRDVQDAVLTKCDTLKGSCTQLLQLVLRDV